MEKETDYDQETGSKPFLNYDPKEKGGLFDDEWPRSKQATFPVTLMIINNTKSPQLHNLMLVHSNLQNHTHLYRALYQEVFCKFQKIEGWPVFKEIPSYSHHDGFQLQFGMKKDGQLYQYANSQLLVGTIQKAQNSQDNSFTVKISINEDIITKIITVSLQYSWIQSTENNIFSSTLNKSEIFKEIQINQSKKSDIIGMKTQHFIKAVTLYEKNQHYFKELTKLIDMKNQSIRLILKALIQKNQEFSPYFNEYSFLTEYLLKDQEIFITNPDMKEQNESYYEEQFKNLEIGSQFTTIEEQSKKYQNEKAQHLEKTYQSFIKSVVKNKNQRPQCYLHQSTKLGNCYFIAAIDQIISKADFILDKLWIFENKQKKTAIAVLNIDGKMNPVKVDFNLFQNGEMVLKYSHFSLNKIMPEERRYKSIERAILVEKCHAKIYEGYQSLDGGWANQVFMMLTNHNTTWYPLYQFSLKGELSQEKKKEIVKIMQSWNQEMKNIEEDYQKIIKQVKQKKNKNKYFQTSFKPENKRTILPVYTFIVISNFQKQRLKKIFPEMNEKNIQTYCKHVFSFQGIWPQEEQFTLNEAKPFYVKLRDLRDGISAIYWRSLWYVHQNPYRHSDYLEEKVIFSVKTSQYENINYRVSFKSKSWFRRFQIFCDHNEFILDIRELFTLLSSMQICQYYPYSNYYSIPVLTKKNESLNLTTVLQTNNPKSQSFVDVTLHQKCRKPLNDQPKEKKQITQLLELMNKTNFQLEYEPHMRIPFLHHFNYFALANFSFPIARIRWEERKENQPNKFSYRKMIPLRVHMDQKQQLQMYYISILVKKGPKQLSEAKGYLDYNHNILLKSPISYHKFPDKQEEVTGELSSSFAHQCCWQFSQKKNEQKEARVYCQIKANFPINQTPYLQVYSHCINQNFLEVFTKEKDRTTNIIDDFLFIPDKDQQQKNDHLNGKFVSETMMNWNQNLLDGKYVLRISFTQDLEKILKQKPNIHFEVQYRLKLYDVQ